MISIRALITLFVLTVSGKSFCQELTGFIDVAYATYKMQSINHWQENVNRTLPVIITKHTPFDPSLNYSAELTYHKHNEVFGIFGGAGKSESEVRYATVDGEAALDMNWSFRYVGLSAGVPFVRHKTITISPNVRFSAIKSTMLFAEYGSSPIQVVSWNAGICPNVSISNNFKMLVVRIRAGYEFQIPGKLHPSDDKSAYLADQTNQDPIKVNGDGMRLSIAAGYILNYRSK